MINFKKLGKRPALNSLILSFFLPFIFFGYAFSAEVRIGVVLPLSGPLSDVGSSATNALMLATEEINKKGGVKSLGGASLRLDIVDWGSNPLNILTAGGRYGAEQIPIIIGTGSTSATTLLSKITDKFKIPLIECSSPLPTDLLEKRTYTTALTGSISQFVEPWKEFIAGKKVIIVHDNSDLGLKTKNEIISLGETRKILVTGTISIPYGRPEVFEQVIAKLKSQRKAIMVQATSETLNAELITYFKRREFKPYGWVNTGVSGSTLSPDTRLDRIMEGMLTTSSYFAKSPIKGNKFFVKRYKERFNQSPDSVAGMYWNSVWFIKDVLERAKSIDRNRVMSTIRKSKFKPGENNIYIIEGILFDRMGRNIMHIPNIVQIQDGRSEIVWPKKYKTSDWVAFSKF